MADYNSPVSAAVRTFNYTYGNEQWGDQLTAFDGHAITYDSIGNPLNYYNGFAFAWCGRQLESAVKGEDAYSFRYNYQGLRIPRLQTALRRYITTRTTGLLPRKRAVI